MKKLILIVLCFLKITKAISQTPTADRVELDKIYQHINKNAIPTGYLNDYGSAVLNKVRYNGLLTDSNFVPNMNVFRLTLNDLLSAKINPSAPNLPSVVSVNNNIEPMLHDAATPLIFNISKYDTLHEMAVINNLLTFTNGSFYDVAGRSQSPYQTVNFFAACPINEDASATGTITLTYNSSLVYSNCGKQVSSVAIDFGFGAGYEPLANGGTISHTYTDSTGYKAFGIKVTCTDGSVYECISAQYVTVPTLGARYAASNILPLTQFPTGTPTINTGYATVVYSRQRQGTALANKLVKPLIIVEGLDENDVLRNPTFSAPAGNKNMRTLLEEWGRIDLYDFNGQLDDIAGYDLIYIDYYTLRKIEDNADMLIGLINDINNRIETVGGVKQQTVVLGIELGGLVARYALAKMTKAGQTTNCRLLITHDAPHQGAYMPLGYQHLVEDFGGMQLGITKFRDLMGDLINYNRFRNSPVYNQFYTHNVNNGVVVTNSFLAPNGTYQSMVNLTGFSPSYQFVATSQGSQCGTPIMTPGSTMLKFEDNLLDFNIYTSKKIKIGKIKFAIGKIPVWVDLKMKLSLDAKFKLKLKVNALPSSGVKEISKVQLDFVLVLKTKFYICPYSACIPSGSLQIASLPISLYNYSRTSPSNIIPYESFAGGTKNLIETALEITTFIDPLTLTILGRVVSGININNNLKISYPNPTYSYISRVSALDVQNPTNDDYSKPLNFQISGQAKSAAAKYITQEAVNTSGNALFNLPKGRFTKRNATWMFNEMEGINNQQTECVDVVSCYNGNVFPITGDNTICSSSPQPYTILNLPSTISTTWQVSSVPANLTSLSCTNCNTTQVSRIQPFNSGITTLTANLSSVCFSNLQKKLDVVIGVPEVSTSMGVNRIYSPAELRFTAFPNHPAITYHWYIADNPNPLPVLPTQSKVGDNKYSIFPSDCVTPIQLKVGLSTACGTLNISNQLADLLLPQCKRAVLATIPDEKHVDRFGVNFNYLTYLEKKVSVNLLTNTSDQLSHLFFDADPISQENVAKVRVLDKEGNEVLFDDHIQAKKYDFDVSSLPEGLYNVEVYGNNDYRELHSVTILNGKTEKQLAEELVTNQIQVPCPDSLKLIEVMKQELFEKLKHDRSLANGSSILESFMLTNEVTGLAILDKINDALQHFDVLKAQEIMQVWQPKNNLENTCYRYYQFFIKYLNGLSFTNAEKQQLQTLAFYCPQKYGEIIFAARSLYNYVTQKEHDYTHVCGAYAGKSIQKTEVSNSKLQLNKISIFPNPAVNQFKIKFPAGTLGTNQVILYDALGKMWHNETVIAGIQSITLNKQLPKGVYAVHVLNAVTGKTQISKLYIQ